MSDENPTERINDGRSFEERVFERLNSIDSRLDRMENRFESVESRLEALEAKQYETKPIWERALAEIVELRVHMNDRFDDLNFKIEVLNGDVLQLRSDKRRNRLAEASMAEGDKPDAPRNR